MDFAPRDDTDTRDSRDARDGDERSSTLVRLGKLV